MTKIERKTRCWLCSSLDVISWGSRNGKQRFKCKHCGVLFTSSNKEVCQRNSRIWFEKWVCERQTIDYISRESGYSEKTLRRMFDGYLSCYPQWEIPVGKAIHILIDGTYFTNKICLIVYRNDDVKQTIFYRTTTGEHSEEIYEDLVNLTNAGVIIESITCDGHKSILKAINQANKYVTSEQKKGNKLLKLIITQRCLIHIQRSCLTQLKPQHQSIAGRELRYIVMTINRLSTLDHKELFINALSSWFTKYKDFLLQKSYSQESGRYWYTHKEVRRAYKSIKSALPNMFHYLDNEKIPRTTNAIEGYFSHLKDDICVHRGLSKKHFMSFLRWYLHFKARRK